MVRIVLRTRTFVYSMVLRRLQLMLFAGYLYPFICFSFCCGLNVSACYFVKVSGKSFMLTVPYQGQCVFAWHISSLHLPFSSPHVCHPHGSVPGSMNSPLDAEEFFSKTFKRWAVFSSQLKDIFFQCNNPWVSYQWTRAWIFLSTMWAVSQYYWLGHTGILGQVATTYGGHI